MSKVLVVGGGAAGMFASIFAAKNGNEVHVFEKNEKLGKKLFITGKGRCNVTNACDVDELFQNMVSNEKFMYSSFYGFTNQDVMDFFERLDKQNYPGSAFNCYNEENRQLMKDEAVADLLQRNCRNPLKETVFTGKDCQKGQPVIISEFVHTNEIERLVRICRFAGYVRMNLTSQENEDTSPFTSLRVRRDFGLMHRDMTPTGYEQANQADFIFLARPWLTGVPPSASRKKI